jgi:hypothetical protein
MLARSLGWGSLSRFGLTAARLLATRRLSAGPTKNGGLCSASGLSKTPHWRDSYAHRAPQVKEHRMRKMKISAMAVIVVFAMSALTATSAAAHPEFLTSVVGGKLTGKLTETQVFKTVFGNVECTALNVSGETIASRALQQHVTVFYSKCKAFGLAATITPALYLFLSLGSVHIVSPILITSTSCHLRVLPQTVQSVTYSTVGNEIILTPNVTGIAYEGTGATCSGSAKDGTYEGKSLVSVIGGSIGWMA